VPSPWRRTNPRRPPGLGDDTSAKLREFSARLAELKRQGREALSIEDRVRGGRQGRRISERVRTVDADVHNNLTALGDPHYLDTGENGTVAFFADNPDKSEMRLSIFGGGLTYLSTWIICSRRSSRATSSHCLVWQGKRVNALP
jgi:hypothetical protein